MPVKDRELQWREFADFATLEKLLEVGQSLIVVRDLDTLLQKITESAGAVLGANIMRKWVMSLCRRSFGGTFGIQRSQWEEVECDRTGNPLCSRCLRERSLFMRPMPEKIGSS
jgi:hypothetical protein